MSGAPFTDADIGAAGTRPGVYINFIQQAEAAVTPGSRGTVGIISESDWGPPNAVQSISTLAEAAALFTTEEDSTARLYNLIRLAFRGGAQTVKAVRVMNATGAAKSTLNLADTDSPTDVLQVDAKYEGTYGDNISIEVGDDPVDDTKTRIRVYVDDSLVHSVTSTVNHGATGFIDNIVTLFAALESEWITVTKLNDGNDDLADITATNLASGANGNAVSTSNFETALALFNSNEVNLLTSDTVASAVQVIIKTWVEDRREEGYRVMGILGSDTSDSASTIITDAQSFNSEGIVYVGPGAIMPNAAGTSTTYNGATVAAMVAGIIAGLASSRSTTNVSVPTTTGVETNLTNAQVKSMLAAGVCVITPRPSGSNPGAKIERGLTTLYNPSESQIASMKKIRTVRTFDAIASGLAESGSSNFIGQVLNDASGQRTVIDAIRDFLNSQAEARIIKEDFTVALDDSEDNSGEKLFISIGITPIDAVEMIFTTIEVAQ